MQTKNAIIVADIRDGSPSKNIAISLYKILEKSGLITPTFYSAGDQAHITKNYPYLKTINSLMAVKNAIIILLREVKNFFEIDATNKVIYFAAGKSVDYFVSFVLTRVNIVIATNYATAFRVAAIAKQLNINIPIYRIQPMYDYDSLPPVSVNDTSLALVVGNDSRLKCLNRFNMRCDVLGDIELLNGTKISQLPSFAKYDYLIYMDTAYDQIVYEAMLCGLVVIAQDRLPFSEYIVNGINGYLTSSEEGISHALSANNNSIVISNLEMREALSQSWWPKYLLDTIDGIGAENLRSIMDEIVIAERHWIIPKMILQGDKEITIPSTYDRVIFKPINEQDLEHILIFFTSQPFREVYVFGWEYGNHKDISRNNRITNLIRAFGRRILNIYWCTDDPIPQEWGGIFNNLSIIGVPEALKRIRPISNI